jgi:hypothetical protein
MRMQWDSITIVTSAYGPIIIGIQFIYMMNTGMAEADDSEGVDIIDYGLSWPIVVHRVYQS